MVPLVCTFSTTLELEHVPGISDSKTISLQRKKGSKNEKLQNEFQKVTNDIKQELQSAHLEVVDLLKRKLTETTEEKETLHLEYQTALNKIQEAEKMISDLKMEAETLNGENSKLLQELVTESSQLREKLGERERELKGEIEKQKADELSSLLKKLEEKEKDSLSQIEDMTTWINNLQLEVDTLQTQKSKLEEQLVRDSNEASGQVKDLLDKKILEMSEYLVRIGTLEKESEKNIADQWKMLDEKEGLTVQVKDLEREVDSLRN
ncbi:hypothetical protein TEA_022703 [Camellia sinensis var. sinensis]|uniref:Uncharacterized protein n=1 Tax=Camellia sinensis var. sinensis TaxID=542762 RepID=A0A4S4F0E4_CAMSN|nr:hypothetical protein TEA_022703 [Camellia sinensis var. sinensis]